MSHPGYAQRPHGCVAATGETWTTTRRCDFHPDSAHRCRRGRELDPHYRHECGCGAEWICLDAVALDDHAVLALLQPARHEA